jgi:hypothetical protein
LIVWKFYNGKALQFSLSISICACPNWSRKGEGDEQNKRKYINRSAYEAHAFWSTGQSQPEIVQMTIRTNISTSFLYDFNRSLPFRLALIKTGPNAGTRYKVARNAKIENPKHE